MLWYIEVSSDLFNVFSKLLSCPSTPVYSVGDAVSVSVSIGKKNHIDSHNFHKYEKQIITATM